MEESISADALLVPGDLTHTAKHAEAQFGVSLLKDIAAILGVDNKNVFIVPGNHDVDWTLLNGLSDEEFEMKKKFRFLGLDDATNTIFSVPGIMNNGSLFKNPYFNIWDRDDYIVAGINSAYDDLPTTQPHYGRFYRDSISKLNDELKKITAPDKIKICLIHHHPIQYSDPVPNIDFSVMVDSELLFDVLDEHNFDFLIHGHKHVPMLNTHRLKSGRLLNVLCSGSFSAYLSTKLSGFVNNQFHLIEIHDKDSASEDVKGIIKSWAYKSTPIWEKSSPSLGIRHILPFGSELQPHELQKKLTVEIQSIFSTKSFIKVSDITNKDPLLKYIPYSTLIDSLKKLEQSLNFELHVDTPKIRAVSLIIKFTEYDTKKVYPEVQDQGGIGSLERAA
ncbi:metallophosphoesterase family protein [Flagellimonas oceanensis]|uniref:metallophosphoesterase family protein n=1 Tax=Flagellimonas oceanensis TaxID=2499163 RepID=UPI0013DF77D0|nr:metallophosphoesterase [Allomuricauda oceanensis]